MDRTQINVVKSKGILKAPSAAAIRQLTTAHNLGLGVDFRERKSGEPGEKPSKHGRDHLQQFYSQSHVCCVTSNKDYYYEFQVFSRTNTRLYPGGHPSSYNDPVRPGLTWNSVLKGNVLIASVLRLISMIFLISQ